MTTRNVLRSVRFCLPMLRARTSIARQLSRQPGLIRYASGITSPTEFLTLTVWESREHMQRFMQTGAHEQHMWLFTRWTASFWGMRWEPGGPADELGSWSGLHLAQAQTAPRSTSPLVAAGLLPPNPPRAGPLGPRPEGVALEPRASAMFALTARFDHTPTLFRSWRAARRLGAASGPVRHAAGFDLPPQVLAISIWDDAPGARELALQALTSSACATWAMCWQPADYEIGHWDGLRLRQLARRRGRGQVD